MDAPAKWENRRNFAWEPGDQALPCSSSVVTMDPTVSPRNSCVEALTPSAFGDGASKEEMKAHLVNLMLGVFLSDTEHVSPSLSLSPVDTQREGGCVQPERGAHTRPQPCCHLDLGLLVFSTMRK